MTEQNFTTQVPYNLAKSKPAKSNLAKIATSILLAQTQTPPTKANKQEAC